MKNEIKERSYEFALKIVGLVRKMPKDTSGFVLGRQLIKSGTSIGVNVEEAAGAFSKDDFIYKMNIALKEARETHYWLRLLKDTCIIKDNEVEEILEESAHIKNILSAIVKTSREKREKREKVRSTVLLCY